MRSAATADKAMQERRSGSARRLLAGLGNPGDEYRDTRHNLGFRVIDLLASKLGLELDRLECSALLGRGEDLLLVKPQTYMNRSGYALRCLVEKHGFEAEDILVIYDDVDLPLGRTRFRPRGGPGGHRGMESVIHNLRSDEIPRLRLGIGRPGEEADEDEMVDYVLAPFAAAEREEANALVERAVAACETWLAEGIEIGMRKFNG